MRPAPDGRPNPTYRCLFPSPPPPGAVPTCAEAGVLGALAGVMGSLMAMEVIREIVGFGEGLVGRLLMVDARAMRFDTVRYGWDEANPLSGATVHSVIPGRRESRDPGQPSPLQRERVAPASAGDGRGAFTELAPSPGSLEARTLPREGGGSRCARPG